MSKIAVNIKLDKDVKKGAQELAQEFGMPFSVLVNVYLKELLREQNLNLSATLEPTPYLEKIMREAEKDIAAGRTSGPFQTVEEMVDHLKKNA